jgi:succinate dehydrogenase / fumarate reductase cytochrome b subunit
MRQFYQRNYFLLRRLHSLLGIIPVGAFFLVHMLLNSRAAQSPEQYQWVPNTLDEVPFIWAIELFGIILPIAFHALLGALIIWQGSQNAYNPSLGWYSNWAYLIQRYTGVALFVLIGWHLYQAWWPHQQIKLHNALSSGTRETYDIYGLMSGILHNPLWLIVYGLFVLIAAYHFGNGIYNFTYKWGVTTSKTAQRWAIALGLLVALVGVVLGYSGLWGLRFSPWAHELMARAASLLLAGR